MPTPYTRLTRTQVNSLLATTLGNLKPYQLDQVKEFLDHITWKPQGSQSSIATQPTMTTILAAQPNNP